MCILAQFLTAGVTLPAYFASHILTIPNAPTLLPVDALTRVRTLLPAIILGFLLPSSLLLFPPKGVSVDTIQKISAVWQPFPFYIFAIWSVFRKLDSWIMSSSPVDPSRERSTVLVWLKRSYYACGLIAAWAHLYVFLPSLVTNVSSQSFANIFIPYWMHPYLPISLPAAPLAAYRPCSRLLFQHDWLIMVVTALAFFARSHMLLPKGYDSTSLGGWALRMVLISVIGGPGAALAWAAIKREERIASIHAVKKA